MIDYSMMIGKRVQKSRKKSTREPKPFKSGFKINTVKAVVVHPQTGEPGFTFQEDGSIVKCSICSEVE